MRSLSYLLIAAPLVSASNSSGNSTASDASTTAAAAAAAGNSTTGAPAAATTTGAPAAATTTGAPATAAGAATTTGAPGAKAGASPGTTTGAPAAKAGASAGTTTAAPKVTQAPAKTDAPKKTEAPKNASNETKSPDAVMETTKVDNVKVSLEAPAKALEAGPVCELYGMSLAMGVGTKLCAEVTSEAVCEKHAKLHVDFDDAFKCKAELEKAMKEDEKKDRRRLASVKTGNDFSLEITLEKGSAEATALAAKKTTDVAAAMTAKTVQREFTMTMFTMIAGADLVKDAALKTALLSPDLGLFADEAALNTMRTTVNAALATGSLDVALATDTTLKAVASSASNVTADLSTMGMALKPDVTVTVTSNAATVGVAGSLMLLASTLF